MSEVPRAYSLHPGKCVDSYFRDASSEQNLCALAGGGAGGKDIIDEEESHALHPIRPRHSKGPLDVFLSLSPTPALSLRGPDPLQYTVTDAETPACPNLLRQERRLVKASRTLPLWMERNRNQEIELAGIKESSGPLDHQTTEVASKRATAAVLSSRMA